MKFVSSVFTLMVSTMLGRNGKSVEVAATAVHDVLDESTDAALKNAGKLMLENMNRGEDQVHLYEEEQEEEDWVQSPLNLIGEMLIKGAGCQGCLKANSVASIENELYAALQMAYGEEDREIYFQPASMQPEFVFDPSSEISVYVDESAGCNATDADQMWDLLSARDPTGTYFIFRNHGFDKCLATTGCSSSSCSNNRLELVTCDRDDPYQIWGVIGGNIVNFQCYWFGNDDEVEDRRDDGRVPDQAVFVEYTEPQRVSNDVDPNIFLMAACSSGNRARTKKGGLFSPGVRPEQEVSPILNPATEEEDVEENVEEVEANIEAIEQDEQLDRVSVTEVANKLHVNPDLLAICLASKAFLDEMKNTRRELEGVAVPVQFDVDSADAALAAPVKEPVKKDGSVKFLKAMVEDRKVLGVSMTKCTWVLQQSFTRYSYVGRRSLRNRSTTDFHRMDAPATEYDVGIYQQQLNQDGMMPTCGFPERVRNLFGREIDTDRYPYWKVPDGIAHVNPPDKEGNTVDRVRWTTDEPPTEEFNEHFVKLVARNGGDRRTLADSPTNESDENNGESSSAGHRKTFKNKTTMFSLNADGIIQASQVVGFDAPIEEMYWALTPASVFSYAAGYEGDGGEE